MLVSGRAESAGEADTALWVWAAAQGGSSQATAWLEQNAANGSAAAKARLAALYETDAASTGKAGQALALFQSAAEAGDPFGQFRLAGKYAAGEGVGRDDILAYKWANLAAVDGGHDAVALRDAIAARMTRAQINLAQDMAREWFAGHRNPPQEPAPTRAGAPPAER